MSVPAISVVMPVFNGARYLRGAVRSILAQNFADLELVAVNDGSTDHSDRILEEFATLDPRVRVIHLPNGGIVAALTAGLAAARAPVIARMDADDLADPDRLRRQLDYLRAHPDCVALGTAARLIDASGRVIGFRPVPTTHEAIVEDLLSGNGAAIIHPAAMFKRSALDRVGGYDASFCRAEDLDLYFRLAAFGKLENLPEPLLDYREHPQSTNFSRRSEQLRLMSQILDRERTSRHLAPLEIGRLRGTPDLSRGELHREWACGAHLHGSRSTAIHHALVAIAHDAMHRQSWRTLRYVMGPKTKRP